MSKWPESSKGTEPPAKPNDSRRDHRDPLVSVPEGPSTQLTLSVPSLSSVMNTYYFVVVAFREREGNIDFVAPPIQAFIGCFLDVSRPGMEPATLAYQDFAITNCTNQPG